MKGKRISFGYKILWAEKVISFGGCDAEGRKKLGPKLDGELTVPFLFRNSDTPSVSVIESDLSRIFSPPRSVDQKKVATGPDFRVDLFRSTRGSTTSVLGVFFFRVSWKFEQTRGYFFYVS